MAIREILQLGDPRLRHAATLHDFAGDPADLQSLIVDLRDTLAHWREVTGYGRGIAAPQLGLSERVIFLQLAGAEPWPLINPQIVQRSEEKIVVWDACLSFLAIFMQVERHKEIFVRYQNVQGEWRELRAGEERDLSELLQHEIDHLDGILCIDRVYQHLHQGRIREASPRKQSVRQKSLSPGLVLFRRSGLSTSEFAWAAPLHQRRSGRPHRFAAL